MPKQKLNFWTKKDSEIIELLEQYDKDCPSPFDRKKAITLLEAAIEEAAEKEAETKSYVEQLKEEDPGIKMVSVIFHSLGEQDIPYVFVGHNGACFYLPKEQEIEIPAYLLESCIKDAVEDRLIPETGAAGQIKYITRRVQRFPYTVVSF